MDLPLLRGAHPGSSAARCVDGAQVNQVRLRYEAFFGQTRGVLDGGWAWEDTQAAYLLLDSLALREETSGLARFLFEDFAHYFTSRKAREPVLRADRRRVLRPRGQRGDGGAGSSRPAGFNTSLVLAPQVVAGMGDPVEAARILGSVETVICHRVNTPEEIIALAGTRRVIEYSSHYAMEGATGEGSARMQHQYKVDPNKVRSLPPGAAYIISRGRAMKAQVAQAPQLTTPLPEPAAAAAGRERGRARRGPGGGAGTGLAGEQTQAGGFWRAGAPGGVPSRERGRMKG